MLKAECEVEGHGYVVRVAASHVRKDGPPICPKHMAPMAVDLPDDEEMVEEQSEAGDDLQEAV